MASRRPGRSRPTRRSQEDSNSNMAPVVQHQDLKFDTDVVNWPPPISIIVGFYDPNFYAMDYENRSLNEILAFSNAQLEYYHDYIQILFPLPERSPVNPSAPLVTKETCAAFLTRPPLQQQLTRAFERMLRFYGFAVSKTEDVEDPQDYNDEDRAKLLYDQSQAGEVTLSWDPDFEQRSRLTWRKRFDHNHLRITRMIRCLRILGLKTLAAAFFHALTTSCEDGEVSARTLSFWKRAAERPLHLAPEDNDDAPGISWLRQEPKEEVRS